MPGVIYLLSALTCLICAILLLRSYLQRRARLLLWSGLCFVGLVLENIMLYVDLVVVPDIDMEIWRKIPGLVALALLLFGLIWESNESRIN